MTPTAMPAPTSLPCTSDRLASIALAYLSQASPSDWQIWAVAASTVRLSPGVQIWAQNPPIACAVSSLLSSPVSDSTALSLRLRTADAAACQAAATVRTWPVWAFGQNLASGPGRNHTVSPGPVGEFGLAIRMSSKTGSGA